MFATRFIPISILLLASTVGCAGLQDTEFAVYNWASAEKTWLTTTTATDRWYISSDYRKGWKDGFRAQLNGTGCYGPPAPPPCYWSPKYRNCEGKEAVANWYAGWHAGVAAAECKGDHRIPVGENPPRLLNSGRHGCAVQDGCNGALPCNNSLPCNIDQSIDISAPLQQNPPTYVEPILQPAEVQPNYLPDAPVGVQETSGLIGPVGSSLIDPIPISTAQLPASSAGWNR